MSNFFHIRFFFIALALLKGDLCARYRRFFNKKWLNFRKTCFSGRTNIGLFLKGNWRIGVVCWGNNDLLVYCVAFIFLWIFFLLNFHTWQIRLWTFWRNRFQLINETALLSSLIKLFAFWFLLTFFLFCDNFFFTFTLAFFFFC